jgi:PAS domain S-box-containing protein
VEVESGATAAAPAGGQGWLEPLLDLLPTPLLLIEPGTARLFYANRAAHGLADGALPIGEDAEVLDREGHRLAGAEQPTARAARGERFAGVQVDWRTAGGLRTLTVAGDTIRFAGGAPIAVLTLQDVTPLEAARRRSTALAETGALLTASLDYRATLEAVAKLLVPRLADWCFVEMLQADGSIERTVMRCADPAKRDLAAAYDRRWPLAPDSPVGSPRVIRTGEAELQPELPEGFLEQAAQDPEQAEILRGLGFRSAMIVPLRVRGQVIGDLALATAESGRRFDADDLATAQDLADRCALHIEVARLFTDLRTVEDQLRGSHDELQAILEGVADSITAQAPDGRLVYANAAAVQTLGYEGVDELLSAPLPEIVERFDMLDEAGRPLALESLPGRLALQGLEPEPVTVRYRRRPDGELRWARVQSRPVRGADGAVRLAINVIEDISELKRAEEAHRFLAEASRVLAGSLDYEETLRVIARLAVPEIGDWCAVDLLDETGEITHVATAHAEPEKVALAHELRSRYPSDPDSASGVANVLRTGRAELWGEIPDALLEAAAVDAEHLRLIREVGMVSAMVVPMRLRGRTLGAITLVSAESRRRFDEHDLATVEDLATRAATAVDNARLYRTRSAIAQTLQASLLPPELPELPGVELAARYRPAGEGFEVGGDFYDVFSVDERHWFAVVGDVCGKGAEAAAVTALARYTIRTAAVRRRSPAAILRWLADAMLRQDPSGGRFCTIVCVHLDLARTPARVTVSCGGHPLPLVRRADGSIEEVGAPGTLLGLVRDPHVEDRAASLHPGDTMVLYTDGLTEARAPAELWTSEDLAAALGRTADSSAGGIVDHLLTEALGGEAAPPRDDIAALALRAVSRLGGGSAG